MRSLRECARAGLLLLLVLACGEREMPAPPPPADGSLPQPRIDERPFAVFRATRISADHPGLAGRELRPLDPQPAWFDWQPKAP